MGHRANYVVIENGQAQIYFSRWGALTIPAVVLSGPEATIAYVRGLTPDTSLLDCVWAEGGMLLNLDQYHMLFWGGDDIDHSPYLRRPLLAVLHRLWPGWAVDWAMFDVADLAQGVGWDVNRVLKTEFDNTIFLEGEGALLTDEEVQASPPDGESRKTLLTVRWQTGVVKDYHFSFYATHLLSLGPHLLELMSSRPGDQLPLEQETNGFQFAFVDEGTRTLWLGDNSGLDPRNLTALERRWPGWKAQGHAEGLVRHVLLSGRDPTPLMMPEQQAIDELVKELTKDHTFDPHKLFAAIQSTVPPEERQNTKVGVGFFSADAPPMSQEERREMLKRLFEEQPASEKPSPDAADAWAAYQSIEPRYRNANRRLAGGAGDDSLSD